jgi:tripartite-type tricarboxylate transporter receptor subunit TctC
VTNIEEAKKKEVILGGTGAGSGIVIIPTAMNNLLGTKFKMVMGYKSSEDLNLALQRGEVEARAFSMASVKGQRADWVKEKKINFIAQAGAKRAPEIPDVPLLTELATNDEDRAVLRLISSPPSLGRPFTAPPEVPAERLAILRDAFQKTLRDKAFQEEAARQKLEIHPLSAEEITRIVDDVINAPPKVVERAQVLMGKGKK